MNFFEHQDNARRQTRWLIFAFVLAVIAVVLSIDALIYLLVKNSSPEQNGNLTQILLFSTIGAVGFISIASLYRTLSLRGGGYAVALDLGGVPVSADERDPLRRRLRNIVEEMAIASGVPVPDIYVLEKEAGINAFAAGYTPATAAVAVTRGALEKLEREELQGVIAHEFSHILNGDMRLNIRMIGILFGITLIAFIGRKILRVSAHGRGLSRNREGGGIMIVGLGMLLIGYIGLFFARWIKASVSRKREYLADASAVQFTRNPDGIGDALKRIAVDSVGVEMHADVEEVSHMMFGSDVVSGLLATHPSIINRIQQVEPDFKVEDLELLRKNLQRKQEKINQAARDEMARKSSRATDGAKLDFGNIVEQIGNPGENQMFLATLIAASISNDMHSAARSTEWAREVVCLLLLDDDPAIREQQKLIIVKRLGNESLQHIEHLEKLGGELLKEHRLPLAEIAFPALRRRPIEDIENLQLVIEELIKVDGKMELFEFALARMLQQFLDESLHPAKESIHGRKTIEDLTQAAKELIATVATLGHEHVEQRRLAAEDGLRELGLDWSASTVQDWRQSLDNILPELDQLNPMAKEKLVKALVCTVTNDHEVTLDEAEILRAICSRIHVPLPIGSES